MDYNKLNSDEFVKMENDGIISKAKRKTLGITITSLCFAIGISGSIIFYDRDHSKNTMVVQNIKSNEFNSNSNFLDSEYEIIVFKRFVLNNGIWDYQGLVFVSPDQIPVDSATESYIFIGGSKIENDKLVVYEKQSREISFLDDETYSIDSDWQATGEYIITNPLKDAYLPPVGDIGVRYIYLGTNNKHIHINAQLGMDVNGDMYITDTISQDSDNIKIYYR